MEEMNEGVLVVARTELREREAGGEGKSEEERGEELHLCVSAGQNDGDVISCNARVSTCSWGEG